VALIQGCYRPPKLQRARGHAIDFAHIAIVHGLKIPDVLPHPRDIGLQIRPKIVMVIRLPLQIRKPRCHRFLLPAEGL
jgi:hypothetical protein